MKFVSHPLNAPDIAKRLKHIKPDAALIDRLAGSLELLRSRSDALTTTFYAVLFAQHPRLRGMFPSDMSAQRKKLFESLEFVVTHLHQPELVRPALTELGKRHVTYGARADHYPVVRDTLVGAMRTVAETNWSDDLEADWLVALELIGGAMQAGNGEG